MHTNTEEMSPMSTVQVQDGAELSDSAELFTTSKEETSLENTGKIYAGK